jgi:RNA-directed DNA polymerase
VSDASVLRLVKMWLKASIEDTNEKGRRQRCGSGNRGTPQGGVLSPLLANIYMRRFLKAWEEWGVERRLKARIVNYADDFVILCRSTPERALAVAKDILERIGLRINGKKTRTCNAWNEPFDFLGYSFGRQYYFGSGNAYLGVSPSKRSIARLKGTVRKYTHLTFWSEEKVVRTVNSRVRGWTAYFSYGSLWKPYVKLERFLQARIRRWLVRKHKLGSRGECRYPVGYVYDRMGLVHLPSVLKGLRTPC